MKETHQKKFLSIKKKQTNNCIVVDFSQLLHNIGHLNHSQEFDVQEEEEQGEAIHAWRV
jgi:hypothetical protein